MPSQQPDSDIIQDLPSDPMVPEERSGLGPRSLTRTLGIIATLAQCPDGMSLAELVHALQVPKSSLLSLVRSLAAEGYLVHSGATYRLGARSFKLAANILAARQLRWIVRPHLENLARRIGETVYFAVLDQEAQIASCVEVIDSPNPIRFAVPIGTSLPLTNSAAGCLLLAYQHKDWLDAFLAGLKPGSRDFTHSMSLAELRQHLATIREDGISVSLGMMVPGAMALASPVFNAEGDLLGALVVAGPEDRLAHRMDAVKDNLREAARLASGLWDSTAVD